MDTTDQAPPNVVPFRRHAIEPQDVAMDAAALTLLRLQRFVRGLECGVFPPLVNLMVVAETIAPDDQTVMTVDMAPELGTAEGKAAILGNAALDMAGAASMGRGV